MSEQTEKNRATVSEVEKKTGSCWWKEVAKEIGPMIPLFYNIATKNVAGAGMGIENLQQKMLTGHSHFDTVKEIYTYAKNYLSVKKYERTNYQYLNQRKGELKRDLRKLDKQETKLLEQKGEAKTKEEKREIDKNLKPVLKDKEEKRRELKTVENRIEKVNARMQKEADKKAAVQGKTEQNRETVKKVFNKGKESSNQGKTQASKAASKANTAAKSTQQQSSGRKR